MADAQACIAFAGGHAPGAGWDTHGPFPARIAHDNQLRDGRRLPFPPIAYARTPYTQRIDAPHQSTVTMGTESGASAEAAIVFVDSLPAEAFADLAGFERIWLLFVFHRSDGWKPRVRPPRGGGRRSVLATRSPHRPNAIGLSAVELAAVETRSLRVRGMDLLDGTPILDIKPYVPYADAFAQSGAGWINSLDAAQGICSAPGPRRPRRPSG